MNMLRRTKNYLLAFGLIATAGPIISGQPAFAQAQSASNFTKPVSVSTAPDGQTSTGPTVHQNSGQNSCNTCSSCSANSQTSFFGNTSKLSFSSLSSSMNNARHSFKSVISRARLDYNRNAAWPQPFVIADRAAYKGFIQPCINRGWEIQNTLSDDCFDGRTGRLNRMGAARIRDVVHAAPVSRKSVFVYSSGPKNLVEARVKEVQSYLIYEFGRSNGVSVAVTRNFPHGGRGIYAENMVPKYYDALPTPALNGDSVSSAINGGN